MEPLEFLAREIESIERQISRRRFLKLIAFSVIIPPVGLGPDNGDFLRRMAYTLIPDQALAATGIDVIANLEHLLKQGSPEHRAKVLRLLTWARRISFIYGGEKVAIRARGSRFVLVQKMAKALSSLCLVAFWADERALRLIDKPPEAA
jgi:hypothetical protein